VEVRKLEQLHGLDSLIILGGESTSMANLTDYHNLVGILVSLLNFLLSWHIKLLRNWLADRLKFALWEINCSFATVKLEYFDLLLPIAYIVFFVLWLCNYSRQS
jgi:hypothetical protein